MTTPSEERALIRHAAMSSEGSTGSSGNCPLVSDKPKDELLPVQKLPDFQKLTGKNKRIVTSLEEKWVEIRAARSTLPATTPSEENALTGFEDLLLLDGTYPGVASSSSSISKHQKMAADTIQTHMKQYLQQRPERTTQKLKGILNLSCQTLNARSICTQRFVLPMANILLTRKVPKEELDSWCSFLQSISKDSIFTESNWIFRSSFEPFIDNILTVLLKLGNDRSLNSSSNDLQASIDAVDQQEMGELVSCRLAGANAVRVTYQFAEEHFSDISKGLARKACASWLLKQVEMAFQDASIMNPDNAMKLFGLEFGSACLTFELFACDISLSLVQLQTLFNMFCSVHGYSTGQIDGATCTQEILKIPFQLMVYKCGLMGLQKATAGADLGPACALLEDFLKTVGIDLTAKFGAQASGSLWAAFFGDRTNHMLREAYRQLGLSYGDAENYTNFLIEAKLESKMREADGDTDLIKQVLSAYLIIRTAGGEERENLRDPWEVTKAEGLSILLISSSLDVLGLDPLGLEDGTVNRQIIKSAFNKKVIHCHPDKGGSPEAFMAVYEAYELLNKHLEESSSSSSSSGSS